MTEGPAPSAAVTQIVITNRRSARLLARRGAIFRARRTGRSAPHSQSPTHSCREECRWRTNIVRPQLFAWPELLVRSDFAASPNRDPLGGPVEISALVQSNRYRSTRQLLAHNEVFLAESDLFFRPCRKPQPADHL
jgi:hypothetical protein